MHSFVSLFAGAGGSAQGAKQAGLTPVGAVEWNGNPKIGAADAIAQIYAANHGAHVIAEPVECVDYKQWAGVTMGQASPVCTRFSVANAKGGESEVDIHSAEAVARFLLEARPKLFVLENVTQYAGSVSLGIITDALTALGYRWQADNLNSADYGVAQTRRRLIVRAVLGKAVPPIYPTHCDRKKHAGQEGSLFAAPLLPWNGWYDAIEWLIPTLPESQLAEWQKKRIPPELLVTMLCGVQGEGGDLYRDGVPPSPTITSAHDASKYRALFVGTQHKCGEPLRLCEGGTPSQTITSAHGPNEYRALLIAGDAAGDRPPTCGTSAEPCFTLKTPSGGRVHRALLAHPTADNERFPVVPADDPAFTVTCFQGKPRAVLVSDQHSGDGRGVGSPCADAPAMTVDTRPATKTRAILENCRVVSLTVEALAALQSFPRDYRWPNKDLMAVLTGRNNARALSAVGIGNAVPPGLMEAVCKSLLEAP